MGKINLGTGKFVVTHTETKKKYYIDLWDMEHSDTDGTIEEGDIWDYRGFGELFRNGCSGMFTVKSIKELPAWKIKEIKQSKAQTKKWIEDFSKRIEKENAFQSWFLRLLYGAIIVIVSLLIVFCL